MKSIFKKLAFVLALAMVVTLLPSRAVSAADGPQMYSSLLLYLDNGSGKNSDVTGTFASERYAKVYNWRESGYTAVSFESADESVATVNSKGLVTAVKVGSTTVTATFTADDLDTVTKTCKVTVKRNATKVGLSADSAKQVEEGIKAGEKVQLTAVRKDVDGNTEWNKTQKVYTTDGVRFSSSNPEVFTVAKTTGMLTAVAPGEATLRIWTVQSEGKDAETGEYPEVVSKEYTVKVLVGAPVVTGATVKSVTKIELNVEGVTKDNVKDLKIMNEFGGDIKTLFKDPVLSEDGKTVTIEKYVSLVNDEKLSFAFGEEDAFQLVVKIGEVANIVLVGPSTVVVGADPADIDIRVLDANGIELAVDLSRISFKVSDETFAYANGGKISIFQVGKTVTLDATYNTGKFDDKWNLIELKSNQITVTGVEAATIVAQEMLFNKENKDYSANPVKIYVGENPFLHVQVTLSDKDKTKVVAAENIACFTFETLDPSVLLVDAATGKLVPVKAGTARVLVKFEQNNAKINGVATIQVLDNPKLVNVVADKPSVAISNAVGVESAVINLTGKNQYGTDIPAVIDDITCLTKPSKAVDLTWEAGSGLGTTKLQVTGNNQVAGTYNYRVTLKSGNDKASIVVSIVVKAPSSTATAASYKFVPVSGNVEVDPTKIADDNFAKYQFQVVAQDGAGVAFKVVKDALKELTVKIGGNEYSVTPVDANGVYTVNFVTTGSAITVSGSAVSVSDLHGTEGNVIANGNGYTVGEGDFVITGKLTVDGVDRVIIPLTGNVTIKKGAPSVTATTAVVKASAGMELVEIQKVLKTNEAKYTVLDLASGDVLNTGIGNGNSYVLVKSVKVAEDLGNGKFVVHTVALNQYFSVTIE